MRFARPALLAVAIGLIGAGAAGASSPYVNPFPTPDYYVGRTDMGVDVCLNADEPVAALGDGVVVGIQKDWFEKQPYIWYQLTSGPYAGRYVYVAEQITHLAKVGQRLTAGDTIATYAKKGSCIETGWSAADGATLAQTTTGYHEGEVTTAGISFARFLISLGVQGQFELTAPRAQTAAKKKRRPVNKKPSTVSASTSTTATTTRTTTSTSTTTSRTKAASGGSSSAPPGPSGGAGPSGSGSSGSGSSGGGVSGGSGWS